MSSNQERLSQDLVFDLLSSPRRRFVLYHLREEGPEEIHDLAAQTAAWEYDTDVEELTSQQRKRVYVSLYQSHLPELDDAGVVDYDRETGEVRLTDRGVAVSRYLVAGSRRSPRWQRYYLAVVAGSVALWAASLTVGGQFGNALSVAVAAAIPVVFLLLSAAHTVWTRRERPTERRRGREATGGAQ